MRLAALFSLTFATCVLGQSSDEDFRRALAAKPIAEIPSSVPVTDGKLALVAVAAADGEKATIYVINDSTRPVSFSGEDGNFYVKREAFVELEGWHRAQSHWYSDCGNSYGTTLLPPKTFFVRSALLNDAKGQPVMKVRFRIYDGENEAVVSNVLTAPVDPFWLEWCKKDQMAMHAARVDVVADVALNGLPVLPERLQGSLSWQDKDMFTTDGMMWIRMDAIRALETRPPRPALRALEEIVRKEQTGSKLWTSAVESICEIRKESPEAWASWLMAPEQQKRPELLELSLFRLGFAAARYSQRWPENFEHWLDGVLKNPASRYWANALPVFAAGHPRESKVKRLTEMWKEAAAGIQKELLLEAVRRVSPHRVLGIAGGMGEHYLIGVTIKNIGGLPIDFETQHPLDVVTVSLVDEQGKPVPQQVDWLRDQVTGKPAQRIHLEPDDEIKLGPFDVSGFFDLGSLGDTHCHLRIRTNLPQFGELPATNGSSSWLHVKDGRFAPL